MRVVVGINVPGGGSLVDSQALEAEVGRRRSTSLRRRIQDNFAQHCDVQAPHGQHERQQTRGTHRRRKQVGRIPDSTVSRTWHSIKNDLRHADELAQNENGQYATSAAAHLKLLIGERHVSLMFTPPSSISNVDRRLARADLAYQFRPLRPASYWFKLADDLLFCKFYGQPLGY